jgi:hypothetical protein
VGVILDTSVLIEWERKAGSLEAYAASQLDDLPVPDLVMA